MFRNKKSFLRHILIWATTGFALESLWGKPAGYAAWIIILLDLYLSYRSNHRK